MGPAADRVEPRLTLRRVANWTASAAGSRGMSDAPRDERGMKPDPALWIKFPASRLPGKISSGGERTRTADFHVANVALYQLSYTPKHNRRQPIARAAVSVPAPGNAS